MNIDHFALSRAEPVRQAKLNNRPSPSRASRISLPRSWARTASEERRS